MAVDRKTKGKGCGSQILGALKLVATSEAAKMCAQPLLLTQADNACISFWEKRGGFIRARDASDLTRSLRRESGCSIFTGATPMALVVPAVRLKSRGKTSDRLAGIDKNQCCASRPLLSLSQKHNMPLHAQR